MGLTTTLTLSIQTEQFFLSNSNVRVRENYFSELLWLVGGDLKLLLCVITKVKFNIIKDSQE